MGNENDPRPNQELLGLDFVFETGLKKIEEQGKVIEALDLKMSVLFGFLGAVAAGVLAGLFAIDQTKARLLISWKTEALLSVSIFAMFVGLVCVFLAFRVRQYYTGIRFVDLVPWTNENVQRIKEAFLPTLIRAIVNNEVELAAKQRHAARAVRYVFLALLALLASVAEIAIRLS